MLDKTVSSLKFEGPVVGIHVRRTDKVGTEAAFHPVEEYMKYVAEWFEKYELTHEPGPRRVFVASDDPKVRKMFYCFIVSLLRRKIHHAISYFKM
jgi:glycoprotein 6-alpha-L-fucosyltransferase